MLTPKGRPKKIGVPNRTYNFHIATNDFEEMVKLAGKAGLSPANWLRRLIHDHMISKNLTVQTVDYERGVRDAIGALRNVSARSVKHSVVIDRAALVVIKETGVEI